MNFDETRYVSGLLHPYDPSVIVKKGAKHVLDDGSVLEYIRGRLYLDNRLLEIRSRVRFEFAQRDGLIPVHGKIEIDELISRLKSSVSFPDLTPFVEDFNRAEGTIEYRKRGWRVPSNLPVIIEFSKFYGPNAALISLHPEIETEEAFAKRQMQNQKRKEQRRKKQQAEQERIANEIKVSERQQRINELKLLRELKEKYPDA